MADYSEAALRTVPAQNRSRATVERILDAATELLCEGGPDALTTSALSERTGLRVRNVYRYFSDRHAIMATLAERMNGRIESAVAEATSFSDPNRSLQRAVNELVDRVLAAAAADPAAAQIRAAMRSSPELQALERASDRRLAVVLADGMAKRGARVRRSRLEAGLIVVATSVGAVLDRAGLAEEDGAALVLELKRMVNAYLAALM